MRTGQNTSSLTMLLWDVEADMPLPHHVEIGDSTSGLADWDSNDRGMTLISLPGKSTPVTEEES